MIDPLVGKQRRSVQLATSRINVWEGSVRSSKTVSSMLRWLQYVRTGPPGNLLMVGKTERTLRRNIVDVYQEWLGKKRCKPNWGDGELLLLGRRIYLAGANDEKAVDKVKGITLAGTYGDEITTWPESFWAMLLSRLSIEGAQGFFTTNPDNPLHWLMRDYLKRARLWVTHDGTLVERTDGDLDSDGRPPIDLARFSFNLRDNPALPPRYVEDLSREFTGLWRKRYIDGLWVVAEGAVYDTFDTDPNGPHVVTALPRIHEWVVAVDYGTTNPFVALLIGLGADERIYVAREWRWDSKAKHRQLTDGEYSQQMRAWLAGLEAELPGCTLLDRLIVDPSAASFIAQLWRDGWAGVRGADNTVLDGIRSVSTLLAKGRLKVHVSCTGTIEEMAGYVWDPKASERGEEKPVKVADHGPDALRYGVMGTTSWWRHWLTVDLPEAA